jgi:hypothetical protein
MKKQKTKKKSSQSQIKFETEKSKTSEKPENVNSKEVLPVKDEDILTLAIDQNKPMESRDEVPIQKDNIKQQQQQQQQLTILRKADLKAAENGPEINPSHTSPKPEDHNGKLSTCETPQLQHHSELSILIMKNAVADRIVSNYSSGRERHQMVEKSPLEKHKVLLLFLECSKYYVVRCLTRPFLF